MPVLEFTCPFCKKDEIEYEQLGREPGRRFADHDCPSVEKRSYVFADRHTAEGTPIYLRCLPVAAEQTAEA